MAVKTSWSSGDVLTAADLTDTFAAKADIVAWTTWTPTYANLSGGTLNVARYTRVGKLVTCYWKYTLAGAGVSGAVSVSLPVTASSSMPTGLSSPNLGWAAFDDAGVDQYQGAVILTNSTNIVLRRLINDTNNIKHRDLSATAPFTFGNADSLFAFWSYEAA